MHKPNSRIREELLVQFTSPAVVLWGEVENREEARRQLVSPLPCFRERGPRQRTGNLRYATFESPYAHAPSSATPTIELTPGSSIVTP